MVAELETLSFFFFKKKKKTFYMGHFYTLFYTLYTFLHFTFYIYWICFTFYIYWICKNGPFLHSLHIFTFYIYWICYNIASVLCFGFWPKGMWDLSSPTSGWTCTPCIGRQVLTTGPPGKLRDFCPWLENVTRYWRRSSWVMGGPFHVKTGEE